MSPRAIRLGECRPRLHLAEQPVDRRKADAAAPEEKTGRTDEPISPSEAAIDEALEVSASDLPAFTLTTGWGGTNEPRAPGSPHHRMTFAGAAVEFVSIARLGTREQDGPPESAAEQGRAWTPRSGSPGAGSLESRRAAECSR